MTTRGPSAACPSGNKAQSPFNKSDTLYRAQDNMVSAVTTNHRLGKPPNFTSIDLFIFIQQKLHVGLIEAEIKLSCED